MKISDIVNRYNQVEQLIQIKKNLIEDLREEINSLNKKHHWLDSVIEPLAKEIAKKLNLPFWKIDADLTDTIYITIYFAHNKKDLSTKNIKSIKLYPDDSIDGLKLFIHPNINITDISIKEVCEKFIT